MACSYRFGDIVRTCAATAVFSAMLFAYAGDVSRRNSGSEIFSADTAVSAYETQNAVSLETSARACALMDARTGEVLYSKNADERLPMASTTKIMTAIVALENFPTESVVAIPDEAVGIEGSSIYLSHGEKMTMLELLYGLLLESGNDAAAAIAVAVGGSEEKFVDMMNKKAEDMGLSDTHFDNPHGLTSETHYTTARELAKLAAYALENETFATIVAEDKYVIPEREDCRARYFSNHNRLVRSLDICDGVKTGYTIAAGRCLVTSASDGDSRFVAVTLNDRRDWNDHTAMLTFAVEKYESIRVLIKGELKYDFTTSGFPSQRITVSNTDDIYITLPKGSPRDSSIEAHINKNGYADGDTAGELTVTVGEKTVKAPLSVTGVYEQIILG